MTKFNFSRLECYLECPTKYYYQYVERLYDPHADMFLAQEGHRIQSLINRYWEGEEPRDLEEKFLWKLCDYGMPDSCGTREQNLEFGNGQIAHLDGFNEATGIIYEIKTAQDLIHSFHKHRISYQVPMYAKAVMEWRGVDEIGSVLFVVKMPKEEQLSERLQPKAWCKFERRVWTREQVDTILKPFEEQIDKLKLLHENKTIPSELLKNYTQCRYCSLKTVCSDNDFTGLQRKPVIAEELDL